MADNKQGLTEALERLAILFEYGHLQAQTDPVAFIDGATAEIRRLRAAVTTARDALVASARDIHAILGGVPRRHSNDLVEAASRLTHAAVVADEALRPDPEAGP